MPRHLAVKTRLRSTLKYTLSRLQCRQRPPKQAQTLSLNRLPPLQRVPRFQMSDKLVRKRPFTLVALQGIPAAPSYQPHSFHRVSPLRKPIK